MQGGRVSVLAAPLGGHVTGGLSTPLTAKPKSFLMEMPAPRTHQSPPPLPVKIPSEAAPAPGKPLELTALEGEGEVPGSDLAKAVLAQSQALTALVGQIAQQSDPLSDLSSSSTTFSSRGSMGRVKLQQELAAQRGVFFHSVCQNMARRMYPSQSCDLQPMELMQRGVSATRYLERFGGFGKSRDLGQIAWLVAILMDHLQSDNLPAAKAQPLFYWFAWSKVQWMEVTSTSASCCEPSRRSAIGAVHKQELGPFVKGEEFRSFSGAALDLTGAVVHKRARRNHPETCRPIRQLKGCCSTGGASSSSKGKDQGCSKSQLEKEPKDPRGGCRGMSYDGEAAQVPVCPVRPDFKGGHKTKNKFEASQIPLPSLEESISFPKLLAALPRWILSSRTPFAGFLAKTFHIHRCGSSPASVTFPLPLPQLGLFRGAGPKLSHRRWICLLRKRILHLVVVALNFLHYGYSPSVLQQLGRRPNALQLQIYSRLWAHCHV